MQSCQGITAVLLVSMVLGFSEASTNLGVIEARYGTLTYSNSSSSSYYANLTLTNTGSSDIKSTYQPVSVYACFIRLVLLSDKENGTQVEPDVTVYHLDGCAHKIVYDAPFSLSAGESRSITLLQQFWSVTYTDVMPNWYIQLGDGNHQLITNTNQDATEFVDPFDTEEKYLRAASDTVLPLTLKDRYKEQKKLYPASGDDVKTRLIPDVFDSFSINDQTQYTPTYPVGSLPPVSYKADSSLGEEQFTLMVSQNGDINVSLFSITSKNQNIALSTLTQLLERFGNKLPVGSFTSTVPRFGFRAHMLDIARQFHGLQVIKRQLDLMWRYKMNILHLHLVDDESWALEINGIPELTQFGSKQCFNLSECGTYPQLGSLVNDGRKYLTKAEYIEIVRYAETLGITVLPEIELPGHSTAAIQAMRLRYENSPNAVDYRLHDPLDKSVYESVQYFTMGAMNPCVESMYTFVEAVITTVQSYHQAAGQELKIIHLAGDEVAKGAWTDSPACDVITAHLGNATDDEKVNTVKIEMMKRIGLIAERTNVSLAFWEDGLINKTSAKPFIMEQVFPSTVDVYTFIWQTVWEWWGGDRAFNMANGGYKVVLAPATRFYLDHPQEPHTNEHGYYWAVRSTNLKRAFSFRPINYYANIDGIRRFGAPITEAEWCNPDKCPPLVRKENIIGVEAPLFGETIRNQDHIDNNVWPRMMAVAERAWNEGEWERLNGENPSGLQRDFDSFHQSVERYEIPSIEENHNVKYHLSPPGANIVREDETSMTLQMSVEFEGQRVWWRRENSQQWAEVTTGRLEYTKDTRIYLRTCNSAGTRYSYEVLLYKMKGLPTTTVSSSTTTVNVNTGSGPVPIGSKTCRTMAVYFTVSDSCRKFAMSASHPASNLIAMPCSAGTLFDLSICGCNHKNMVDPITCRSK